MPACPLRDVRWTVTDKWQTRDGKVEMLQAGIEQGLVLLIVQAKVSMDYFQKPTEFDEYRQVSESSQTSIKEFHTVKLRKGGFSQFLLHVPGTDAAVSAEWYDVEVPADTPIGNATAAFAVSKDQLNVGQISFSYAETNKAALQKGNRW